MGLDANTVDLFNRFRAPTSDHPLGTDELGAGFVPSPPIRRTCISSCWVGRGAFCHSYRNRCRFDGWVLRRADGRLSHEGD